jgi:hypothetical protein
MTVDEMFVEQNVCKWNVNVNEMSVDKKTQFYKNFKRVLHWIYCLLYQICSHNSTLKGLFLQFLQKLRIADS